MLTAVSKKAAHFTVFVKCFFENSYKKLGPAFLRDPAFLNLVTLVSPNPTAAKTEKSPPSAPTSKKPSRAAEGTAKKAEERPSVRQELKEIKAARQAEAETPKAPEPERAVKKQQQKPLQHQPPKHGKKHKNKSKVR